MEARRLPLSVATGPHCLLRQDIVALFINPHIHLLAIRIVVIRTESEYLHGVVGGELTNRR